MSLSNNTAPAHDDKPKPPAPMSSPSTPVPTLQKLANPFDAAGQVIPASALPPVQINANPFETIECAEDEEDEEKFNPQPIKLDKGETVTLLLFFSKSISLNTHWHEADDFTNACINCWGKENGCPLCRSLLKPQAVVFVPAIDIGTRMPGYVKMDVVGIASSSKHGKSLFSQLTVISLANNRADTTIRLSKNLKGMFVATSVPLPAEDLPPQDITDRFMEYLTKPVTEILGEFIGFVPPAELMQVGSIQRMVTLAERG